MINKTVLVLPAFVALLALASTPGQAQQEYLITVNTTTLSGLSGYVDLQFNPGGLDALAATVTVSNVVTDGSLASTASTSGGATGKLPGPPLATIVNSAQYNDLFQGISFGSQISFDATITGAALTPSQPYPSSGSTFAVSLYDSTGNTPLLTTNPDGSIVNVDVNPNGTTGATVFAGAGGKYWATATLVSQAGVPESATALSLLIGLGLTGCSLRRNRSVGKA